MTATTTTLAEFLLARIAEDEEVARKAQRHYQHVLGIPHYFTANGNTSVAMNPRVALAECEAKRRIVEQMLRHERLVEANAKEHALASSAMPLDQERITALRTHGWELSGRLEALRIAVDALALPFADHPDYREEWRP